MARIKPGEVAQAQRFRKTVAEQLAEIDEERRQGWADEPNDVYTDHDEETSDDD